MSDVLETAAPPIDAGADPAQDTVHATANTAAPQTEEDHANAALDAHDVIKTHVIAAMAVGLMPVPGVDMAGTIAVQVRMVSKICEIYGVTIRENVSKTAVLSLVGGVLPVALAGTLVSSLKFIPGFGTLAGAAGASLLGGATTYAVGSVFQQHLATHDSLIDFDVDKMKAAMRTEFDAGMKFTRSLRSKVTDAIVPKAKADATPAEAAVAAAEDPSEVSLREAPLPEAPTAEAPVAEAPVAGPAAAEAPVAEAAVAEAPAAEAAPMPPVEAPAAEVKEPETRKPTRKIIPV